MDIKKLIKEHVIFVVILVIVIIMDIILISAYMINPAFYLPGIPALSSSYPLFGLSMQAVIFIYSIAIFLIFRWIKTGKNNISTLLWAIAFMVYGIVFIGLIFLSFGMSWANTRTDAILFFIWRNPMIIWVALMYVGIAKILTESKKVQYVPAIVFAIIGYITFIFGLLLFPNEIGINGTMALFLYTLWVPLCYVIGYSFYLYGKQMKINSARLISLGFVVIGITYMAWAPWHVGAVIEVYYFWFFMFNVGLVIILMGYVVMPYEIKAKNN